MGLQGPGTKQGVIDRNVHCKPANEVTRYPEKVTGDGYKNFRVHFTTNCQKTVLNWKLNVLKESRWIKSNCFTSQLKYLIRLEGNVSLTL